MPTPPNFLSAPAVSASAVNASAVSTANANELAQAMDIPSSDIVSASIGTSDPLGVGVGTGPLGSFFPTQGTTFAILASGYASTAALANDSGSTSSILAGLNNSQGNDMVQLRLTLRPPSGATCLAFDAAFYSEEFPEFVGSSFNDAFTAEIGGSNLQIINNQVVSPLNFAFDTTGNPISVNTVFGVTGNTGTTYDGATPRLRVISPLEPGAYIGRCQGGSNTGNICTSNADCSGGACVGTVDLVLSIQDLGDSIYDSAVFLDNFAWLFDANCVAGAIVDSDGDGLLDEWEIKGIDVDHDGKIDIDLPAMGADPKHKDIFVEADYMVQPATCILGFCFGGHTHKPKADALQLVIDAFNVAPVMNPDGTTGIRLHIDAGPDTVMDPRNGALWGNMSASEIITPHDNELGSCPVDAQGRCIGPYDWTEFDQIKGDGINGHFSIFRRDVFHYVVFAHNLGASGHSGLSRGNSASDFIVSLGSFTDERGTTNEQAGTLMHELGHNLALRHGGSDDINNKPNYLSVMNYLFQNRGLRIDNVDAHFDYSVFGNLPVLDESKLNETVGIFNFPPVKTYGTGYFCSGVQQFVNNAALGIDWNCSGPPLETSVAEDVNNDGGPPEMLHSFDDWGHIRFDGGAVGKLGQVVVLPMTTDVNEMTMQEDALLATPFAVTVAGPGDVILVPGAARSYAFTVTNRGENADTYNLSVSSTMGWADPMTVPASVMLAPGQTLNVAISVQVPLGATEGTEDQLMLKATSHANPLLMDSVTTVTAVVPNNPDVVPPPPPDSDRDGIIDDLDNCPFDASADQQDTDHDGVGDVCDNCPHDFNPFQTDVCGAGKDSAASTSTAALSLKRVRMMAAPNGTIRLTGVLDTTQYGGLSGFVTALHTRFPAHATTASTVFRQGNVFAFNVSGAGLAAPGQTMWFPACASVAGCSGTNGESVSFFRKGATNLFTVDLRAQGKTFPPPLSSGGVTVTLSLGGTDDLDHANCLSRGSRHGVAACRK